MTTSVDSQLSSPPSGLRGQIHRLLHDREVPYGMAAVRILLPVALLVPMVQRWIYARELFSTDGAATPLWVNYGSPDMLPVPSGEVAVALFSLLLFSLVSMSVGWQTRIACAVSFVLYTYMNLLDAVSTITKYTCIASHALLLLSFARSGAVWSVDAWLRRRKNVRWPGEGVEPDITDCAAPHRMLMLLVGMVYFGAAITKMQTPAFFSGDQLSSWMITNVNFGHPLGEHLTLYPALLVAMAYVTVVWEVMFVFMVWRGPWRLLMLGTGVFFHVMTYLTLGLVIFPMVCISVYFAFLNQNDVQRMAAFARRMKRRFGWKRPRKALTTSTGSLAFLSRFPSPVVYAATALLAIVGGLELEYRLDPYGVRRPEGRYTLKELETQQVLEMLRPTPKLRESDKFAGLEVGTMLVGGMVVDRRNHFRQGERLVAQCLLTPPHEDMYVSVNLHDADDHVLNRTGKTIEREMLRSNFNYVLPESLEPGEYYLVVTSRKKEITRRLITLLPADAPSVPTVAGRPTASAN